MLPISEYPVTFQQVISKLDLFLFKPSGRGDIEILGTNSVEGSKTMHLELNNLDPQKSNNMAKNTQQKWTRGFLQHWPMCSGFAAVLLVFSRQAGFTLPDPSSGDSE